MTMGFAAASEGDVGSDAETDDHGVAGDAADQHGAVALPAEGEHFGDRDASTVALLATLPDTD